ncbi:DNA-binding IclR family transcriptional regulator [Microbacterium testaceum]|nr:DNA-binding IclR family transcriptional regulator [Microbacterium testaceum]
MTARVEQAVAILRAVAGRTDPTSPLPLAAISASVGAGLSTASRVCAGLVESGMLERGEAYGTFATGPRALALSGSAAAALGPDRSFRAAPARAGDR